LTSFDAKQFGSFIEVAGLLERRFKLGADLIGIVFETISK
jgi:hypothetical protein